MFSTERDQLRKLFFESWRKYNEQLPLEPLEMQLIDIILLHPEYHTMLSNPDHALKDFDEANPFLHMSLHLALREQIQTNRPAGIQAIHQALCIKLQDKHLAEHRMMDCLADILWQAQQTGQMPDEQTYLTCLRQC
jgi:hypothetical protein